MSYAVNVTRLPARYLRRLPDPQFTEVADCLRELGRDPYRFPQTKQLQGPGRRRVARVGELRVIFTVDDDAKVVTVTRIGPRGQVYRDR